MAKVRLNVEVSPDLDKFLERLAEDEGTTKTEIVRRGLSVMKAFRDQIRRGRGHIGFTADASKLDSELVGILDSIALRASQSNLEGEHGGKNKI